MKNLFKSLLKKTAVNQECVPVEESLDEQLYRTVCKDNVERVIELIKQGAGVNYHNVGCLENEHNWEDVPYSWSDRPLDRAKSEAMKRLLRHFGAKTDHEIREEEAARAKAEREAEATKREALEAIENPIKEAAAKAKVIKDSSLVDAFIGNNA